MIVINNNSEDQELDMNRFEEGLKDFKVGKDMITDHVIDVSENITIPVGTSMIISL